MSTSDKDKTKDTSSNAGRIEHDSRGNAVWKWDKGSDPNSTASTSKMLRKLDLANLQVEGATPAESRAETSASNEPMEKGSSYGPGYNPYDRTAPVKRLPPRKEPSR